MASIHTLETSKALPGIAFRHMPSVGTPEVVHADSRHHVCGQGDKDFLTPSNKARLTMRRRELWSTHPRARFDWVMRADGVAPPC